MYETTVSVVLFGVEETKGYIHDDEAIVFQQTAAVCIQISDTFTE